MQEEKLVHKFETLRVAEKSLYLVVVQLNNYQEIKQFERVAVCLRTRKWKQEKNYQFLHYKDETTAILTEKLILWKT